MAAPEALEALRSARAGAGAGPARSARRRASRSTLPFGPGADMDFAIEGRYQGPGSKRGRAARTTAR